METHVSDVSPFNRKEVSAVYLSGVIFTIIVLLLIIIRLFRLIKPA